MQINKAQIIIDMEKFLRSHKAIVKATTKKVYKPYRMRLEYVLKQLDDD